MTEKINIAKLLKNCPKDMELNCLMYEDVYFDYVDALNIIHCYIQHKAHKTYLMFNQHGTPNSDIKSKCVIFPKGKTTWEGFVPPCMFKDGDVAITYMGDIHLCRTEDSSYCACRMLYARLPRFDSTITTGVKFIRLATEKEKQKLFDTIKDNGYHWDAETKKIEKLTSNKFDITTLVPFESRVLVRDSIDGIEEYDGECSAVWRPAVFGIYAKDIDDAYPFGVVGGCYFRYCIPYEGNEHLLGKTEDCGEYFKNW